MLDKKLGPETKEFQPKIVVEIGPNDRSVLDKMSSLYDPFNLNPGDSFVAVDLPSRCNADVLNKMRKKKSGEPLAELKQNLKILLPEGVEGEVLYADAQKLPFKNDLVDIVYMANMLSGHIKDDQTKKGQMPIGTRKIISEKRYIIEGVRRVLKPGGKLIIDETYGPAYPRIPWKDITSEVKNIPGFSITLTAPGRWEFIKQ